VNEDDRLSARKIPGQVLRIDLSQYRHRPWHRTRTGQAAPACSPLTPGSTPSCVESAWPLPSWAGAAPSHPADESTRSRTIWTGREPPTHSGQPSHTRDRVYLTKGVPGGSSSSFQRPGTGR